MAKVQTLNQVHPTDCEYVLRVRETYANKTYRIINGYIKYWIRDGYMPYEHQLVAQLAYGDTPKGHQVHHKNKNRLDNRADNLTVLSNSDHQKLHNPSNGVAVTCAQCGKNLIVHPGRAKRFSYCNRDCQTLADRKVEWPTPEQLYELLATLNNWCAVGRMFGVSDNAVRKWARNYKINLPICDGRRKYPRGASVPGC